MGTENNRSVADQITTERLAEIGANLAKAFDTLATKFRADMKRQEEAREVAALFELYRSAADDRMPRLQAALDGYEAEYLADLSRFSHFLADAADRAAGRR